MKNQDFYFIIYVQDKCEIVVEKTLQGTSDRGCHVGGAFVET